METLENNKTVTGFNALKAYWKSDLKNKGLKFHPGTVGEWQDCGNKNATVHTNQRVLEIEKNKYANIPASAQLQNVQIVPPCYIGENVKISNSVIGPHASIGSDCEIENSLISNSIVQAKAKLKNANIVNSMLGKEAKFTGKQDDVSISDFSVME